MVVTVGPFGRKGISPQGEPCLHCGEDRRLPGIVAFCDIVDQPFVIGDSELLLSLVGSLPLPGCVSPGNRFDANCGSMSEISEALV